MKVSPSVLNQNPSPKKKVILPLVPVEEQESRADRMISHTLRSQPNDDNSPKYKIYVPILQGDEDCRQLLKWHMAVLKVLHGLNVTEHDHALPIVETLMNGTPLTLFRGGVEMAKQKYMDERRVAAANDAARQQIENNGFDHADNKTFDQIKEGLKAVIASLLPRRVLARVKRFLRRDCRKPRDMTIRVFFQHLLRINNEEIPELPPFRNNQSLNDDEILDILLYATPKSWHKEMERQGFDPMEHTPREVVDFMERSEATDDFDDNNNNGNSKPASKPAAKKNPSNSKGKSNSGGGNNGKKDKYCAVHGQNYTHTTEECRAVQNGSKKARTSSGGGGKTLLNNKWTKQAADAASKSKSDLAAFVQKEVAKGIAKIANEKKRKSSDDSDSDDLAAFDLKDFNYSDMENLKIMIDSDDEEGEVTV